MIEIIENFLQDPDCRQSANYIDKKDSYNFCDATHFSSQPCYTGFINRAHCLSTQHKS